MKCELSNTKRNVPIFTNMWANRICRLCAEINGVVFPMFEKNNKNPSFEVKIKKCLPFTITEQDLKPKHICLECNKKVDEFYSFIELCQTNDFKFETIILERKSKWFQKQDIIANDVCSNPIDRHENTVSSNVYYMVELKSREPKALPILETPPINQLSNSDVTIKTPEILSENIGDPRNICSTTDFVTCQNNTLNNYLTKHLEDINSFTISNYVETVENRHANIYNKLPNEFLPLEEHTFNNNELKNKLEQTQIIVNQINSAESASYARKAGSENVECPRVSRSPPLLPATPSPQPTKSIKPFACIACHKTFMRRCNLNTHMSIHTNIRPFICKICEKSFASKHELNVHMSLHSGQFTCQYCSKIFCAQRKLERHIRVHTGERPFKCDKCSKAFADKRNLSAHIAMHDNLRPHQCPNCDKTFRVKSHLKEHQRVHNFDTPFICDTCGKRFKWKANLTLHLRTHNGILFSCDFCQLKFVRSTQLTKHKLRAHLPKGV